MTTTSTIEDIERLVETLEGDDTPVVLPAIGTAPPLTVTKQICPGRIADLLCSGFEGGMTSQWAYCVDHVEPSAVTVLPNWEGPVYQNYHWPLSPGGAVYLQEVADDGVEQDADGFWLDEAGNRCPVHKLDLESIQKGLNLFATREYSRHFADWDTERDDAITGDVFVQLCLLGEVRYG